MRSLAFVTKGKILVVGVKTRKCSTNYTLTQNEEFLNINYRSSNAYNNIVLSFFPKAHPRREALVWNP